MDEEEEAWLKECIREALREFTRNFLRLFLRSLISAAPSIELMRMILNQKTMEILFEKMMEE